MADQNVTTLGIAVDSSGVRTAEGDLKNFAKAGNEAAKSASVLERAIESSTKPANQAAAAIGKISPASAVLKNAATGAEKFAASAKLTAYQTQQLSFQLQDLGVQIAGGGNPFTALIQQGSQVASTFGGISGAAKTLGSAVGGTTGILAGAAAVIGAFGAAYYQGSEQSKAFRNSITQTGNAAGLTEGKFNSLIARTAELANVSQASAREMALAFVQSGQLSGQALEATVTAGLNIAKATGASIDEVQKQLLSVTSGVANFAATQNRSLNFLTSAQYRYIKSLEDQGQTGKAILVTMEALNSRYKDQEQNIGLIERSWNKAKKAVSDFWEAAKGIGRTDTVEQQIASLERGLSALDSRRSTDPARAAQRRQAIQEQIDALKEQQRLQGRAAQGQAEDAQRAKVGIEYTDVLARAMSRQALAAKTLSDAKEKLAKSDLDASQQAQILAQLQKELDPGASQAIAQSRVEGIKRSLADIVSAYEASESTLEASRQAGILDDQTYYTEKIAYVERYAQARKLALDLENEELRRQRGSPDNLTADRQAIDDKIKDNLAEIGRLQQKATADVKNYGIQAGAALGNASKGYAEARAAAEAYLQTLTRAQDRELALFGAGTEARSREAGRSQIADRYDEERRRLIAEREALRIQQGPNGLRQDQEKQYADLLQINEDYRAKALEGWDDYYGRLRGMQGDWTYGASEALANYAEASRNTAAQSQRVFENAARGMEDAIVTFAQTGKLNFSKLASSIIADILRVEAQRVTSSIFSSVLGAATSFFGGGISVSPGNSTPGITGDGILPNSLRGGRAIGGPVSAGGIYEINERGRPEVANFGGKDYLLTGGQSGTVRPAGEAGSPVNVTVNIGQGVTRNEVAALVPTIVKQVEAAVTLKNRRGATLGT
jgi:lambda family phage tail tape measure protein